YTDVPDSPARRSAQTAMWEILLTLARVMSPILTFTSEEIWQYAREEIDPTLPESVQLTDWPEPDENLMDDALAQRWERVMEVRAVAAAALEQAKASGEVPNPLEALLDLYLTDEARAVLAELDEDPAQLFIVSAVRIHDVSEFDGEPDVPGGVAAVATLAPGEKCTRCWVRSETVGTDENHPQLCQRCAERVNTIMAQ
ncbi:MAG: class I tRNA ligase family protein, partial [Armatimonadetes bacterium]|nr:class I tRNA ligase family protein [Armatimonadota bacterium]